MLTDTSQSTRARLLVCRNLSAFRELNPTQYEGGRYTWSADQQRQRHEGQVTGPIFPPTAAAAPAPVPCNPGTITNLVVTSGNPGYTPPSPYDATYGLAIDFSWDPLPRATSYSITTDDTPGNSLVIYTPGQTNATLYYNPTDPSIVVTLTAQTPCGPTSGTVEAAPCFLAGAQVQMADNTTKLIEDVQVGDKVLGAFGEINTVLALHRPLVGQALMCNINNEHHTTNHHPHISNDKKFYCGNPALVQSQTYGKVHKVIDQAGETVDRLLHGLNPERILQLTTGVNLKTVDGQRIVKTLETYSLPPETQLYNLVIDGSHTYHVDGYAVTGWPREDDFDYDEWTASAR